MKDFLTKNIGWKLLSLAAAILLWIAVASEPELSTFVSVPVEYKNLSPDIEITSKIDETAYLEVRGPSGELGGLPETRRRYAVVLDMSDVGPGEHTFNIDRGDVRLPRGIQLMRAIPSQIRLNFEPRLQRDVPVRVRFAPGLPQDLKVLQAKPEPEAVTIEGPSSHVSRVSSVETDAIELKPLDGTFEYPAEVYSKDPRVRIQLSSRVTVRITVGPGK